MKTVHALLIGSIYAGTALNACIWLAVAVPQITGLAIAAASILAPCLFITGTDRIFK